MLTQVTLETSNSRKDCLEMPIIDFLEYYDSLIDESERRSKAFKERNKGKW